ncbi:MAG: SCO family protein [Bryobacterales bacterium]|nr:SCO family protein [Bryobacterales bacterium]
MKPGALLLAVLSVALTGCLTSGLPTFADVPPFTLTAQDGREFRSAESLNGKIWVADFFFTTCNGPCPRMSAQMKIIQQATEATPDVQLVSFTVDPAHDTPDVLAAYAQRFRANPARWHFLTGPPAALQTLSKDVFQLGDIGVKLDHSTRFLLIDHKGRLRGYYDTSDATTIQQLTEDIAKLRKEAF